MSTVLTPSMKRSALISILRDRSMWPEDFKWDYSRCPTCAIGLLCQTSLIQGDPDDIGRDILFGEYEDNQISESLGLSLKTVNDIFFKAYKAMNVNYWDVTPEIVANLLEQVHRDLELKAQP